MAVLRILEVSQHWDHIFVYDLFCWYTSAMEGLTVSTFWGWRFEFWIGQVDLDGRIEGAKISYDFIPLRVVLKRSSCGWVVDWIRF